MKALKSEPLVTITVTLPVSKAKALMSAIASGKRENGGDGGN